MNWKRVAQHMAVAAIGSPLVYWALLHMFGDARSATLQTFIIVGMATSMGSLAGIYTLHRDSDKK